MVKIDVVEGDKFNIDINDKVVEINKDELNELRDGITALERHLKSE